MGSEGSPLLPIDGLKLACAEQHLTNSKTLLGHLR